MKKKEWGQPKLIILVRGRPEESVLDFCKAWSGGGPANASGKNCFQNCTQLDHCWQGGGS